jgi:hypothetical protein
MEIMGNHWSALALCLTHSDIIREKIVARLSTFELYNVLSTCKLSYIILVEDLRARKGHFERVKTAKDALIADINKNIETHHIDITSTNTITYIGLRHRSDMFIYSAMHNSYRKSINGKLSYLREYENNNLSIYLCDIPHSKAIHMIDILSYPSKNKIKISYKPVTINISHIKRSYLHILLELQEYHNKPIIIDNIRLRNNN